MGTLITRYFLRITFFKNRHPLFLQSPLILFKFETKMSSITSLNDSAQFMRSGQALQVNCVAAKGLQDVMKSNLGPRGTLKMLVGGAGQVRSISKQLNKYFFKFKRVTKWPLPI